MIVKQGHYAFANAYSTSLVMSCYGLQSSGICHAEVRAGIRVSRQFEQWTYLLYELL